MSSLLFHRPFGIIDLQTNSTNPSQGDIVEIGWEVWSEGERREQQNRLVLPAGETFLSKRISGLTGLQTKDFQGALTIEEGLAELQHAMQDLDYIAIYFANFELRFLEKYGLSDAIKERTLCLFQLCKRLIPNLPSYSLRAISGWMGRPIAQWKRTAHHLGASSEIWRFLANEKLAAASLEDVRSLLLSKTHKGLKASSESFKRFGPAHFDFPDVPGTYRMLDAGGRLMYVGKAKSLKRRLKSYFVGRKSKGSRLNEMIQQVKDVQTEIAGSELEAAMREFLLIRELRPPYNRVYNGVEIEGDAERLPLFFDAQGRIIDTECGPRFGPFWETSSVREVLALWDFRCGLDSAALGPSLPEYSRLAGLSGAEILWAWRKLFARLNREAKDSCGVASSHFWRFALACYRQRLREAQEAGLEEQEETPVEQVEEGEELADEVQDDKPAEEAIMDAFARLVQIFVRNHRIACLSRTRYVWTEAHPRWHGVLLRDGDLFHVEGNSQMEAEAALDAAATKPPKRRARNAWERFQLQGILMSELRKIALRPAPANDFSLDDVSTGRSFDNEGAPA